MFLVRGVLWERKPHSRTYTSTIRYIICSPLLLHGRRNKLGNKNLKRKELKSCNVPHVLWNGIGLPFYFATNRPLDYQCYAVCSIELQISSTSKPIYSSIFCWFDFHCFPLKPNNQLSTNADLTTWEGNSS